MIKIKKDLWNLIMNHVKDNLPNEACGLLGGKDGLVTDIYLTKNMDDNSSTRYLINPEEQFRAIKDMRQKGTQMIGIFHSHPNSSPYPSPTDIKLAYYPDAYYVIISTTDPDNPDAHVFHIIENQVQEYPLVIE